MAEVRAFMARAVLMAVVLVVLTFIRMVMAAIVNTISKMETWTIWEIFSETFLEICSTVRAAVRAVASEVRVSTDRAVLEVASAGEVLRRKAVICGLK